MLLSVLGFMMLATKGKENGKNIIPHQFLSPKITSYHSKSLTFLIYCPNTV